MTDQPRYQADALIAEAETWLEGKLSDSRPVVIAASAPPEKVAALQERLGREAAGALVERAVAGIAAALVARGVGRGGERHELNGIHPPPPAAP